MTRRPIPGAVANPAPRRDYVVTLSARAGEVALLVRYVPDKLLLPAEAFAAWLEELPALPLETTALAVMEDLSDELVPRWLEVRAETTGPVRHAVLVEERQPRWDNKTLLDRIPRD